jgi:hypothetical protein
MPMGEIDEEVFAKMKSYNLNIEKHLEEVRKSIKEKRNNDLCGIYELLSHEKLKKLCFE